MRSPRWWIHWAHWAPLFRIIKYNKKEGDLLQYFDAEMRWRLFLPIGIQRRNLEDLLPMINWKLTSFAFLGLEKCIEAHFNTRWRDEDNNVYDYTYVSGACGGIQADSDIIVVLGSFLRKVDKVPQMID